MAPAQLMLLMVIGKFLIWFSPAAPLSACVDGQPKSCSIILSVSAPSISRLWEYDLLLCTVLKN